MNTIETFLVTLNDWVSVTLANTLCPLLSSLLLLSWTFLLFQLHLSNHSTDFDEIWLIYATKQGFLSFSNKVCMTCFHRIMRLSFLAHVVTQHAYLQWNTKHVCHCVISHFWIHLFKWCMDLLPILYGCSLVWPLQSLSKSGCYP